MAYMHMFYGDYQAGDNVQTFLGQFEEDLTELPQLSETKKCHHFYNYCCLGSDTKYWYEALKCTLPIVLTSWFTLADHFHVKWLCGSLNLLLESPEIKQITITQSNTATTVLPKTTTTTTTTMDSIDVTTTDKLQDNEGSAREREEEPEEKKEMGAEEEIPCMNNALPSQLLNHTPLPNHTTIAFTITIDSTVSHTNKVHIPVSLTKSNRNRGSTELGDPLLPPTSSKPAPCLSDNQIMPLQPICAPLEPAITLSDTSPTQLEHKMATTTTNSNVTVEQRHNKELEVEREEEEKPNRVND
jgi:hypothetical protein